MKILMTAATIACTATISFGETWEGEGKLLTIDNKLISEYSLDVHVEEVSPSQEKIKINVRDSDGQLIKTDTCLSEKASKDAWRKSCDGGSSRGYMVEDGFDLGVDYYEAKDGKAYATTIIIDSETEMRLFRTELVDGKATRLFVETLNKATE